jgi:hypothetical protein
VGAAANGHIVTRPASRRTYHFAARKLIANVFIHRLRVGASLRELHSAVEKFFMLRSIFVRFTLTNVPLTWFNARTTKFISTDLRAGEFSFRFHARNRRYERVVDDDCRLKQPFAESGDCFRLRMSLPGCQRPGG